jgi:hypothetical protein
MKIRPVGAQLFNLDGRTDIHDDARSSFNPLTPELNPSAQTLPAEIFLPGILIFKRLTARRLFKSLGVKGLRNFANAPKKSSQNNVPLLRPSGQTDRHTQVPYTRHPYTRHAHEAELSIRHPNV